MPERFLGIDTSNYRTSAAVYDAETGEWCNRGSLLTVPEGAIGLRQSDALFQHTVHLHEKIEALPQGEVRAVGVSTRPRAVEGSYMPCFLAGKSVAHSAAHLLSVPLFEVSHQQGHIAAAALSAGGSTCWTVASSRGICRAARANCFTSNAARTACRTAPASAARPTLQPVSCSIAREICSVCRSRPAAHWTRWRLPPSRKRVSNPR